MNNIYMDGFIGGCKGVLESFGMSFTEGDISARQSPFSAETTIVVIGVTGALHGQAILSMDTETACSISSIMMGGADTVMDEITKSAIAELANMITGNAATLLSQQNVMIDITPPSVLTGDNIHISTTYANFSVPLCLENGKVIGFSLSAKEIVG